MSSSHPTKTCYMPLRHILHPTETDKKWSSNHPTKTNLTPHWGTKTKNVLNTTNSKRASIMLFPNYACTRRERNDFPSHWYASDNQEHRMLTHVAVPSFFSLSTKYFRQPDKAVLNTWHCMPTKYNDERAECLTNESHAASQDKESIESPHLHKLTSLLPEEKQSHPLFHLRTHMDTKHNYSKILIRRGYIYSLLFVSTFSNIWQKHTHTHTHRYINYSAWHILPLDHKKHTMLDFFKYYLWHESLSGFSCIWSQEVTVAVAGLRLRDPPYPPPLKSLTVTATDPLIHPS